MKTICSLLLGLGLLLAGCASHPYAAIPKAGLHTVQLDPVIHSDHDMRYGVDTSKLDDLHSDAASDMENDVGEDGLHRMRLVMRKHNIDILQMIHGQVEDRLRHRPEFTLAEQPPADGTFTVKILQYGFTDTPYSLMHEVPFLMLKIELKDNQGNLILSRQTRFSEPSDDDSGASWDDFEAHPDELRDAWSAAVTQAVNKLLPASK
jgi:hypothetical protein